MRQCMQSVFQTFQPQHPLLTKWISYFYFDTCPSPSFSKKYSFFPHIFTTLTFYKQARLVQDTDLLQVLHDPNTPVTQILTRQHRIKTVLQTGPLDKIGIVFTPLGLNHFIREAYSSLAPSEVQLFNPGNRDRWEKVITHCFALPLPEQKTALLEALLLSLYQPRSFGQLPAVLHHLSDATNNESIRSIAADNYTSHRTLNREFAKHLAFTPELFRQIIRFRYALNQRVLHDSDASFTSLAYESGFTDQSFMIRVFRKLTGFAPREFFQKGLHLGRADTFWHIKEGKMTAA